MRPRDVALSNDRRFRVSGIPPVEAEYDRAQSGSGYSRLAVIRVVQRLE
jgi:hypothetical protein